jgi:hypothetical protein
MARGAPRDLTEGARLTFSVCLCVAGSYGDGFAQLMHQGAISGAPLVMACSLGLRLWFWRRVAASDAHDTREAAGRRVWRLGSRRLSALVWQHSSPPVANSSIFAEKVQVRRFVMACSLGLRLWFWRRVAASGAHGTRGAARPHRKSTSQVFDLPLCGRKLW